MLVLFAWTYFTPTPQQPENTNTVANTANEQQTAQATPQPTNPEPTPPTEVQTADEVANRVITVRSPLYELKLDSKGAVATSWILTANRSPNGETPLWADGSTNENKKPLQLISKQALEQVPPAVPFRLLTADQNLDKQVNERNYQVTVPEDEIVLAPGEERQLEFTLVGPNGVEAKKTFVFRADSYVADLSVDLKQNGQPVTGAKLAIGASIGDHAINHHTFYQIESEAVASVEGTIERRQGNYSFEYGADGTAGLNVPGSVDWAGVSDSYFAMAAIPSSQTQGLEIRASKYEVDTEPFYPSIFSWVIRSSTVKETRHLVTAFVPINADGSVTRVYTGTKDYFLISSLDKPLSDSVGRELEFVNIINFSNYRIIRWIVKPLSIPILTALHYFNVLTNNYGIAIIIFTFLFYSLLFPLRWKQSKSFKKAAGNAPKMKELQDKIKALQKKGVAADDPRMRQLQMEQLKLTKDALPIGGCLPMLLQFPLLIAFYTAITISLEARQASFAWIPDLSAGDPWHLLEFGFAISMVLAMKFTPTGPAVTPEQQMQQKMMAYLMPVMMLWIMWSAPAGLLLYWFFGNIVSFGQQMVINRLNKPGEGDAVNPEVVTSLPGGTKKVKSS